MAKKHIKIASLTPAQERAVHLLLSGCKTVKIASTLGVSRMTIYRWQRLPIFREFYDRLRTEIRQHMNNKILSLSDHAVNTLAVSLNSKSENVRYKTAKFIVEAVNNKEINH